MIPRFKPKISYEEFLKIFLPNKNSVKIFEKNFAKLFKANEAIAFPYGRSAEWAFLKALNIENSEVIMPAYTCSVVAHAISLSNNKPHFVDINLNDFNMDLESLEKAINKNTSAIIATHTFGYPQNMDKLKAIISRSEKRFKKKIWLINDCCHAFGAKWRGKEIGSYGDVAIYALNISKLITSVFGGVLTFGDKKLANKIRTWRDSNFKKASKTKTLKRKIYFLAVYFAFNKYFYGFTWWLQHKTNLLDNFTKKYHLDERIIFPKDYLDLMSDFEASVGIVQLKKYKSIIKERKIKVEEYNKNFLKKDSWIIPPLINGATYSHYVVRVQDRKKIIQEYANKGIELGELIQYSIPELSCYKKMKFKCPKALEASKTTINFPL